MAYSATINGIGVSIDPFAAVTLGPGDQQAEFQSDVGTGASRTITVAFSGDVTNFAIDVVGPSHQGNAIVGYSSAGAEVARAVASFVTPGQGPDATYRLTIVAPSGTTFRSIRLVPAASDYVAYRNMVISGIPVPTVSNSTDVQASLDLNRMIEVSMPTIDRFYVKNSLHPIESQVLTIKNTSDLMDINIGLRGIAGVTFDPPILVVNRGEAKTVNVNFDVSQINSLAEGLNTITAIADLSSGTAVVAASPPPVIIDGPPLLPPPTVLQTLPTDVWTEERFNGSPLYLGFAFSLDKIFATGPYSTTQVQNINYPKGFIQAGRTIRWSGLFTFTQAMYLFSATTDDGMRVWVDDDLIIDQWKIQGATTYTKQLNMTAGLHKVRVEYFNGQGDSIAAMSWQPLASPTTPTSSGVGAPPRSPIQPVTAPVATTGTLSSGISRVFGRILGESP